MTLPKYKELEAIKTEAEIEQEIFMLQKTLFQLKIKRSTDRKTKSHLFQHSKRRIAQLKFKKSILLKGQIVQ